MIKSGTATIILGATLAAGSLYLGNQETKPETLEVKPRWQEIMTEESGYKIDWLDDRKIVFWNVDYDEDSNKDFKVQAHVQEHYNGRPLSKKIVEYSCSRDIEGEINQCMIDLYDAEDRDENREQWRYDPEKKLTRALFFRDRYSRDRDYDMDDVYPSSKKEELMARGKELIEKYDKLFDIEEIKPRVKGKNTYYDLAEFNISYIKDPYKYSYDGDDFKIATEKHYIELDRHYNKDVLYRADILAIEDGYKRWDIDYRIYDKDGDGKVDDINIKDTHFQWVHEDYYKYDKSIYTLDQVKKIFEDANKKVKFLNKVTEDKW